MQKILIILACLLLVACARPQSTQVSRSLSESALSGRSDSQAVQCGRAIARAASTMTAAKEVEKRHSSIVWMKSTRLLKAARSEQGAKHFQQCIDYANQAIHYEKRAKQYLQWRRSVGA